MSNPIEEALPGLLKLVEGLLPFVGGNVSSAVERALTIPEADVRKICKGMSEEDQKEAVELSRTASDALADFLVFVGSRGKIPPD